VFLNNLENAGAENGIPSKSDSNPCELALIEIVSWGNSDDKAGGRDEMGFLHARRIESTGIQLPAEFEIEFQRKSSSKVEPSPWDALPSRDRGSLALDNGEWLIGYFRKSGKRWAACPSQGVVSLARPEDLTPDQLRVIQSNFKTTLLRVWIPDKDIFAEIMSRITWAMPVETFRFRFQRKSLNEEKWQLERNSFRKKITIEYPNTLAIFEFSGVVDTQNKEETPVSSALIKFSIKHPLKERPDTGMMTPPQSIHFQYVKKLHDKYIKRLQEQKVEYKHEDMLHSGYGYLFWEKCVSSQGTVSFVYWANTSDTGVFAYAPEAIVSEHIKREQEAAQTKTRDWPPMIWMH
jgi:hypothetical protein